MVVRPSAKRLDLKYAADELTQKPDIAKISLAGTRSKFMVLKL